MSVHFRHGQWVEAPEGELGVPLDLTQDPNALTASLPGAGQAEEKPKRSRSSKKVDDE